MLARNGIIAHIYIISLFPGGSVNCLHLLPHRVLATHRTEF
jgi:hypothetical protein